MQGQAGRRSGGGRPLAEARCRGDGQVRLARADAGFDVGRDGLHAAERVAGAQPGGCDFAEVGQCAFGVAAGQFHLAERDLGHVLDLRQLVVHAGLVALRDQGSGFVLGAERRGHPGQDGEVIARDVALPGGLGQFQSLGGGGPG